MVFLPIKWIPWIMLAGGIFCLFGFFGSGEPSLLLGFFILGGGGGVLAYFQIKNRKNNQMKSKDDASTGETDSEARFCRNCGTAIIQGDMFCEKCGAKSSRP